MNVPIGKTIISLRSLNRAQGAEIRPRMLGTPIGQVDSPKGRKGEMPVKVGCLKFFGMGDLPKAQDVFSSVGCLKLPRKTNLFKLCLNDG